MCYNMYIYMKNTKKALRWVSVFMFSLVTLFVLFIVLQKMSVVADNVPSSFSEIPESENELNTLIYNLWADSDASAIGSKAYLQGQTKTALNTKGETYWLYNLAYYTNNLAYYAFKKQDTKIMADLADVYMLTLPSLTNNKDGWLAWRGQGDNMSTENALVSAEPIATASLLAEAIASVPNEKTNHTINLYKEDFWPVITNHLDRWIRAEEAYDFTAAAWHYGRCVDKNNTNASFAGTSKTRYDNYYDLLKERYSSPVPDNAPSYCTFMRDDEWLVLTAGANALSANKKDPASFPLEQGLRDTLRAYVKDATAEYKRHFSETLLTDPLGKNVKGYIFDEGKFTEYPYVRFGGYENERQPNLAYDETYKRALETPVPSTLSWDVGHSRRFFYTMSALHRWHKLSGEISFPQESDLKKFANQIFIGIYNGNANAPVFKNYLDGSNGWYLLCELEKREEGYVDTCGNKKPWPPSSMSHYILLYYGNWIEFAPEHQNVYYSLVKAYLTNPQHRARYLSHCTVYGERSNKGCQMLFWPTFTFSIKGGVDPKDDSNTIFLEENSQWEIKTKYFSATKDTDEILRKNSSTKMYRYIPESNEYDNLVSFDSIGPGEGFWYKAENNIEIPISDFTQEEQVDVDITGSRLKMVGNPFNTFIPLDNVLIDSVNLYEQIKKQSIFGVYFYNSKKNRYDAYINFERFPSADEEQFLSFELLKTRRLKPGEGFWLLFRDNSFQKASFVKNID